MALTTAKYQLDKKIHRPC